MNLENRKFNLKMSPLDKRDYNADVLMGSILPNIPDEFIISDKYKIYDQGDSSMCVGFSAANIIRIMDNKQNGTLKDFSPAYIYANRDPIEGDYEGEGHYISQALKDWKDDGSCLLSEFNYVGSYINARNRFLTLPQTVHDSAKNQKLRAYYKISGTSANSKAIALMYQYQTPIHIGASLYKNVWQLAMTNGGVVNSPNSTSDISYGGHALLIVGVKLINGKQYFIIPNSWGSGNATGDNGIFYVATDYPISELWIPMDYKKTIAKFQVGNKNYTINDGIKTMDTCPVNNNGNVFVPVRYLAEAFDRQVTFDVATKAVTLKQVDDILYFKIGSLKGMDLYNLKEITFLQPSYIDLQGRTMVHTRSIADALGLTISWDSETKTVTIQN